MVSNGDRRVNFSLTEIKFKEKILDKPRTRYLLYPMLPTGGF